MKLQIKKQMVLITGIFLFAFLLSWKAETKEHKEAHGQMEHKGTHSTYKKDKHHSCSKRSCPIKGAHNHKEGRCKTCHDHRSCEEGRCKRCHGPRSCKSKMKKSHCNKCHGKTKKYYHSHFFGDLKLRKQVDFGYLEESKTDTNQGGRLQIKDTDDLKSKLQYRLRVGRKFKLSPHWKALFLLKSKSSYHSTGHNFGILDSSSKYMIGIDQVYAEYRPLTREQSENLKLDMNIKVGRVPLPFWNPSTIYMDKDIRFDGSSINISFLDHFDYSLGYAIIRAEKSRGGFTSNTSRTYGDFFLTNHLKGHFSYKQSDFKIGATVGTINDGKKSRGEVNPIALVDGESKSFEDNQFYLVNASWKNKHFPVHFVLGSECLWSSADNGDKKNSRGYVLSLKAMYKKLSFKTEYYNIGDASVPFIGGDVRKDKEGNLEPSFGEFFSLDSFYSSNQKFNGYKGGVAGFSGFHYKVNWKFSEAMKLTWNIYQLKSKDSNRFLAFKSNHSSTSWRTRLNLGIKF